MTQNIFLHQSLKKGIKKKWKYIKKFWAAVSFWKKKTHFSKEHFSLKRSEHHFKSTNFLVKQIWRKLFLPWWQNLEVDYFIRTRQFSRISWAQNSESMLYWSFDIKLLLQIFGSVFVLKASEGCKVNWWIIFRQSKCNFYNKEVT